MQDLLDVMENIYNGRDNMAFFCKFSRDDASLGEITLFSGGKEFMAMDSMINMEGAINASMYEGKEIPIAVPYDFVTEVFRKSGVRRSEFPLLMGFYPEKTLHGRYVRKNDHVNSRFASFYGDMDFERIVSDCRDRIIAGELLQIVLSRSMNLGDISFPDLVRGFMERDRSLYVFLYRIGEFTIAGSSPENLITVNERKAEIYPIAGTIRRGKDKQEDEALGKILMESEKDKLEHRMLVDLARNDLGKVSVKGSVTVSQSMVLRKYATVQHLVSKVESFIREDVGPMDILKAVFPAGTVSGAPKRRAVELIDRYERSPRGAYAGALGVIGNGTMDLALIIRSAFRSQCRTYTQAGAGIVKDSDPEAEGREVISKAMTVLGGVESECVGN